MRSNICKIDKGSKDLQTVFAECEKVAVYNGLDRKQSLHLRLLCEELDGMLPELVGDFDGTLWIGFEEGICTINVSMELEQLRGEQREELLNLAKNRKNAAAVGMVGRIRSMVESLFLNEGVVDSLALASSYGIVAGHMTSTNYAYYWSLDQYKNVVTEAEKEAWDELEKSVIAAVADDITVGIKGRRVDIVITKKFC